MERLITFGKTKQEKISSKLQKLDIEITRQLVKVDESHATILARKAEINDLIHERTRNLKLMESAHNIKLKELTTFEDRKNKLWAEYTEETKKKIV